MTTNDKELILGYVASGGNVGSRTYLLNPKPTPKKHNYTRYEGNNCYDGHGGHEIDNRGVPNISVEECTRRCDADTVCGCVTYQSSHSTCWMRSDCVPSEFMKDNEYDVHIKREFAVFKVEHSILSIKEYRR